MISLILPSYKRADLLNLGLYSISKQKIDYDLEIIVLNESNDKETKGVCDYYSQYKQLNIRHIISNPSGVTRNVVFATNIGTKQAKGEIIILSCPEMFHLKENINTIINPLLNNKKLISIPNYILFDTGEIKKYLYNTRLTLDVPENLLKKLTINDHNKYSATLPFFIAFYKQEATNIGGMDEDFTGIAGEDDDFVKRLIANGLTYIRSDISVIHLFHPKSFDENTKDKNSKYLYNMKLLEERKNTIIRNEGKEWGKLLES
jgi:GT2 family glycosyltransferase